MLAQARAGRRSAAWAAAEELRGVELKEGRRGSCQADRCLAQLAEYYASASLHDDARKTAERIRDAYLRSQTAQSLGEGTETGAAGAASSAGQADEPDDWDARARQMLDQSQSKTLAYDPGSSAGRTFLELADTARAHGSDSSPGHDAENLPRGNPTPHLSRPSSTTIRTGDTDGVCSTGWHTHAVASTRRPRRYGRFAHPAGTLPSDRQRTLGQIAAGWRHRST